MPPLTAELGGLAAVVITLIVVALVVDPTLRATRRANRVLRARRRTMGGTR
jgi:hypothetical protein